MIALGGGFTGLCLGEYVKSRLLLVAAVWFLPKARTGRITLKVNKATPQSPLQTQVSTLGLLLSSLLLQIG